MLKQKKHSIETVFALVLFAVFTVSAVLLVLLGANIYGRIGAQLNKMDSTVILSYVTEKLRNCEQEITVKDTDKLLLREEQEGKEYCTWIYVEDGYLKETLMPEGKTPIQNAGNKIAPIQNFEVIFSSEDLLKIMVTDDFGDDQIRYFAR